MRAGALDESESTGLVAVEDEVLAEDANRLRRALVEFTRGRNRVPVAAHQTAHGRTGADLRELFVLLGR